MVSPVVFGINSSAAHGLNVRGTAPLTEPASLAGSVRGLIERPEWESGHSLDLPQFLIGSTIKPARTPAASFANLVGAGENRRRDGQAH
jgi:hypothetical protein